MTIKVDKEIHEVIADLVSRGYSKHDAIILANKACRDYTKFLQFESERKSAADNEILIAARQLGFT